MPCLGSGTASRLAKLWSADLKRLFSPEMTGEVVRRLADHQDREPRRPARARPKAKGRPEADWMAFR